MPTGIPESSQLECAEELLPLLRYGDMLYRACQELDGLFPITERCLREARRFFFRVRALAEFATTAACYGTSGDENLRQFAIQARDLYSRALAEGDVNNPLQRTHRNHYQRLHGAASRAKELLRRGDRRLGNTTLANALRALQRARPLLAQDFFDSYLLVNMQALIERVEHTHLAPELGQLAFESMRRVYNRRPDEESALDVIQDVMGLVVSAVEAPENANSAAIHVINLALHYWRPDNSRQLWNVVMAQVAWAAPRSARESIRTAIQAGRYEEAKTHLSRSFQHGPATTLAPWLADWLNLIGAVNNLLDAEFADPADQLEAGAALAEALSDTIADTAVVITRGAAWYREGRAQPVIPPPRRIQATPRHVVRRLRRAAVFEGRARTSAQVAPRPSLYMRAALQAQRAGLQAERAAVRTEAAFGAQLFRGNAGYTTVGGSLGLAFSTVNLVLDARDVWNTWESGDTWAARYAEMRVVGSALIVIGMCMSGPLAPVVGLAGLVLQTAGEADERDRPSVQITLERLLADVRACVSTDEERAGQEEPARRNDTMAPSPSPRRTSGRTVDVLGLDLQALEQQLEHLGSSRALYYSSEAERRSILQQLRSLGLDIRELPAEMIRPADRAHSVLL